eukprot:jgi/Chlat1/6652/Chrsp49S06150
MEASSMGTRSASATSPPAPPISCHYSPMPTPAALGNLSCIGQTILILPGALEGLVNLLTSLDANVRLLAAGALRNAAAAGCEAQAAIAAHPEALAGLVGVLSHPQVPGKNGEPSPDALAQAFAAGAVWNLALEPTHCARIATSPNVLHSLIALLRSPYSCVRAPAAGALWNLTLADTETSSAVGVITDALPAITGLLADTQSDLEDDCSARVHAAGTLCNLANDKEVAAAGAIWKLAEGEGEERRSVGLTPGVIDGVTALIVDGTEAANQVFCPKPGDLPSTKLSSQETNGWTGAAHGGGVLGVLALDPDCKEAIISHPAALTVLIDALRRAVSLAINSDAAAYIAGALKNLTVASDKEKAAQNGDLASPSARNSLFTGGGAYAMSALVTDRRSPSPVAGKTSPRSYGSSPYLALSPGSGNGRQSVGFGSPRTMQAQLVVQDRIGRAPGAVAALMTLMMATGNLAGALAAAGAVKNLSKRPGNLECILLQGQPRTQEATVDGAPLVSTMETFLKVAAVPMASLADGVDTEPTSPTTPKSPGLLPSPKSSLPDDVGRKAGHLAASILANITVADYARHQASGFVGHFGLSVSQNWPLLYGPLPELVMRLAVSKEAEVQASAAAALEVFVVAAGEASSTVDAARDRMLQSQNGLLATLSTLLACHEGRVPERAASTLVRLADVLQDPIKIQVLEMEALLPAVTVLLRRATSTKGESTLRKSSKRLRLRTAAAVLADALQKLACSPECCAQIAAAPNLLLHLLRMLRLPAPAAQTAATQAFAQLVRGLTRAGVDLTDNVLDTALQLLFDLLVSASEDATHGPHQAAALCLAALAADPNWRVAVFEYPDFLTACAETLTRPGVSWAVAQALYELAADPSIADELLQETDIVEKLLGLLCTDEGVASLHASLVLLRMCEATNAEGRAELVALPQFASSLRAGLRATDPRTAIACSQVLRECLEQLPPPDTALIDALGVMLQPDKTAAKANLAKLKVKIPERVTRVASGQVIVDTGKTRQLAATEALIDVMRRHPETVTIVGTREGIPSSLSCLIHMAAKPAASSWTNNEPDNVAGKASALHLHAEEVMIQASATALALFFISNADDSNRATVAALPNLTSCLSSLLLRCKQLQDNVPVALQAQMRCALLCASIVPVLDINKPDIATLIDEAVASTVQLLIKGGGVSVKPPVSRQNSTRSLGGEVDENAPREAQFPDEVVVNATTALLLFAQAQHTSVHTPQVVSTLLRMMRHAHPSIHATAAAAVLEALPSIIELVLAEPDGLLCGLEVCLQEVQQEDDSEHKRDEPGVCLVTRHEGAAASATVLAEITDAGCSMDFIAAKGAAVLSGLADLLYDDIPESTRLAAGRALCALAHVEPMQDKFGSSAGVLNGVAYATGIFSSLAQHDTLRTMIGATDGAVTALVNLVECETPARAHAVAALSFLSQSAALAARIVAAAGALAGLVSALTCNDTMAQAYAAGTLGNLANHIASQEAVAAAPGGVRGLVVLLRHDDMQIKETAAGAVRNLALCERGRRELASVPDGVPALLALLPRGGKPSPDARRAAAGALVNLSGSSVGVTAIGAVSGSLDALALMLRSRDAKLRHYCAGTLCNLAVVESLRAVLLRRPVAVDAVTDAFLTDDRRANLLCYMEIMRLFALDQPNSGARLMAERCKGALIERLVELMGGHGYVEAGSPSPNLQEQNSPSMSNDALSTPSPTPNPSPINAALSPYPTPSPNPSMSPGVFSATGTSEASMLSPSLVSPLNTSLSPQPVPNQAQQQPAVPPAATQQQQQQQQPTARIKGELTALAMGAASLVAALATYCPAAQFVRQMRGLVSTLAALTTSRNDQELSADVDFAKSIAEHWRPVDLIGSLLFGLRSHSVDNKPATAGQRQRKPTPVALAAASTVCHVAEVYGQSVEVVVESLTRLLADAYGGAASEQLKAIDGDAAAVAALDALALLSRLATTKVGCSSILRCEGAVPAIISVLNAGPGASTTAAATMGLLAESGIYAQRVLAREPGALSGLSMLLRAPRQETRVYAACALGNLANCTENQEPIAASDGVIGGMVALLHAVTTNTQGAVTAAGALRNLAESQATHTSILAYDGALDGLVSLLQERPKSSLKDTTDPEEAESEAAHYMARVYATQALANLAQTRDASDTIAGHSSAVPSLASLLCTGDQMLVAGATGALRNIIHDKAPLPRCYQPFNLNPAHSTLYTHSLPPMTPMLIKKPNAMQHSLSRGAGRACLAQRRGDDGWQKCLLV